VVPDPSVLPAAPSPPSTTPCPGTPGLLLPALAIVEDTAAAAAAAAAIATSSAIYGGTFTLGEQPPCLVCSH